MCVRTYFALVLDSPRPKKKIQLCPNSLCTSVVVSVFNSDYSLVLRNNKSIRLVCIYIYTSLKKPGDFTVAEGHRHPLVYIYICIYMQVKKLFVKLLFYGRVNLGLLDGWPTCFTILTFYYLLFIIYLFCFILHSPYYARNMRENWHTCCRIQLSKGSRHPL